MGKIRIIFLVICCLLPLQYLAAQKTVVSGKVTDADGQELIGVTIYVKGNKGIGSITNTEGDYTLEVKNPQKDILVFSYIGMKTQEVALRGKSKINVILQADNQTLDEVVVIGYGTSRRKDLTGSVVSVKGDELMQTSPSNVAEALAGRLPGVHITQSEGEPGSSLSIRVRGGISITQSNEPLYVIDGFPSEDGLGDLDPGEIESIDVLKDASSTAIYGARGANGVVLVTTKKGGKDDEKIQISFDSYIGIKKVTKKLPVLSTEEFVFLDYERSLALRGESGVLGFQDRYGAFIEIEENYGNRAGIDWQEEALGRITTSQNYRVNVSGGGKKTKFGFNYSYFKDLGAMVQSGADRHTFSLNVSHSNSKRFQVNARINYNQNRVYGMGTSNDGTKFNKMEHIIRSRPTVGIWGDDSDLLKGEDPLLEDDLFNSIQSPIISATEELKDRLVRNLQINGGFKIQLTKRLNFANTIGVRYQNTRQEMFYGVNSISGSRQSPNGYISYRERGSFQTSNTLNYQYKKKDHKLGVMIGQEWYSGWDQSLKAAADHFPNNDIGLNDMSQGTPTSITSEVNRGDNLISFFGRVNYNLKDKYLVTATLRADGSSRFSTSHKWGVFPSVSVAWRLSEEPFVRQLEYFSDLKLRLGYGLAGNDRVGNYLSLDILSSAPYPSGDALSPGYAPDGILNNELRWEANKTFNVGLDIGLFDQRLLIVPEFYINKSSDLLLRSRIPTSAGFKNLMRNIGSTKNVGIDFSVTSVNIESDDFRWTTNFNVSKNKNTIDALSGEPYFLEEARFGYNDKTHIIEVGKSIGQFYGYKTLGLYQVDDFDYDKATKTYTLKEGVAYMGDRAKVRPGDWKFADLNQDRVINEKDKTVIGCSLPKFYGGINNTINYKQWDFNVFFTYSFGGEVFNATKLTNTKVGATHYNALAVADKAHRWVTINSSGELVTDPAELSALNAGKTVASLFDMEVGDNYVHSWAVEDASFLRLSNLSVGYSVSRKILRKINLRKLRFYVTGSNLLLWTPYSGFDPEVSTRGNALTPGVDYGAYPRNRSFTIGFNATF